MPLDLVMTRQAALTSRVPQAWRQPLLYLALGWAVLLFLFAPVVADMARQFWDSSTYNHILFVPVIIGWLVWLRAPELARLTPVAWWPGLVPLAGSLFLWLLGDISGLALATHLGLVAALQSAVLAMLGPRVATALLFPLLYALFLVPFGDELVPALQTITAHLTIELTHWSGIPAEIEGVFIDTPVGLFEVAEACSGVKFLVAMVALGSLAAHVCFVSWHRRMAFMAAAVVLPVLANGVRAWGTIYIAQSQGIAFAAGFDHIFYGWIFFALVMLLLLALSWRFFDRQVNRPFIDGEAIARAPMFAGLESFSLTFPKCLIAVLLLALGASVWSAEARQIEAPMPQLIELPAVDGWQRAPMAPPVWWQPRAAGADHRLLGSYRNASGGQVDLFFALYASQEEGREAGAFGEGALMPDSEWSWQEFGPDFGQGVSEQLQARGNVRRIALTFYRHRDYVGGSVVQLKLSNMRDRLTFNAQPTMMVVLSAQEGGTQPAEQAIRAFLASVGPIGPWMDRIAQRP